MKRKHICIFWHRWQEPRWLAPLPMDGSMAYARKQVWIRQCKSCGKVKVIIK